MITSFIRKVAFHLSEKLGEHLNDYIFVFPNQRAGLFFRKYLAQAQQRTFISPSITTINQLFDQLCPFGINNDRIDLIITLHKMYCNTLQTDTPLDDFLFWGQMMLNDFDEIDDHLLDAKRIFVETANLKELDAAFTPNLTEPQKEAIQALFGETHLAPDNSNTTEEIKQQFFDIWKYLATIHDLFTKALIEGGRGVYKGLQHKMAVELLKADADTAWHTAFEQKRLVFIGFNALTVSEDFLLHTAKNYGADYYWDYGNEVLRNLNGSLYEQNVSRYPSLYPLSADDEPQLSDFNHSKSISLYSIASGISQAKVAGHILKQICQKIESKVPEHHISYLENTAVVLPNEKLLLPMLNSIDPAIDAINVTMGYPMVATPVYALLDYLCQLQLKKRLSHGNILFYHKDIEAILCHSYVKRWEQLTAPIQTSDLLLNQMILHRRIYASESELQVSELLAAIFRSADKDNFIDYLLSVLNIILQAETAARQDIDGLNEMQIFLGQYIDMLTRLKIKFNGQSPLELKGLIRLIKQLSVSETVSFRGEPLHGLQIMGALEARALDFDNLIILSANEGIFPKAPAQNSYLPFRVRKAYGLPTHELADSIESYNFYRMLTHAQNVYLIYDTRSDGDQRGEVSRYVLQLKYKYGISIKEYQIQTDAQIVNAGSEAIAIDKTESSMSVLINHLLLNSKRGLSASALKDYLKCSLKFYLSRIEHISEDQQIEDTIQNNEFGLVIHKALEIIYNSLVAENERLHLPTPNLIQAQQLQSCLADENLINRCTIDAFKSEFLKNDDTPDETIEGQDRIVLNVMLRYVRQIITRDMEYAPFYFLGAEYTFTLPLVTMNNGSDVYLTGSIDRIDIKQLADGTWLLRVVDYKTGTEHRSVESIADMFNRENSDAHNAMQTMLYCVAMEYMLKHDFRTFNDLKLTDVIPSISYDKIILQPHLFYVRESHDADTFNTTIEVKDLQQTLSYTDENAIHYKQLLQQVIEEMADSKLPFMQTEHEKQCYYCPFCEPCNRESQPSQQK